MNDNDDDDDDVSTCAVGAQKGVCCSQARDARGICAAGLLMAAAAAAAAAAVAAAEMHAEFTLFNV